MHRTTCSFCLILALGLLPFTSLSQSWNSIGSYNGGATDGSTALVVDGKAYIFGGVNTKEVWEYDQANDNWIEKESIPVNGVLAWAFGFVIDDKAYIVGGDTTGGFDVTDRVQMYDPTTDTWTEKSPYGGGRSDGGFAFTLNGKGYVGAGFNGSSVKGDFWEYDPVADTWTSMPFLPFGAVIFPVAFTIGDKGYVGTGSPGSGESKAFWEFDGATKNWSKKTNVPGPARQAAVGFAINGKGYIGGGMSGYTIGYQDFREYDPATDSWSPIEPFPTGYTSWSSAFVLDTTAYVGLGVRFPAFTFTAAFRTITPGAVAPLSLTVDQSSMVKVWPNPTSDLVMIERDQTANGEIRLTDTRGKLLRSYSFEDGQNQMSIDISDLPNALYFLGIDDATIRLIKE